MERFNPIKSYSLDWKRETEDPSYIDWSTFKIIGSYGTTVRSNVETEWICFDSPSLLLS